MNKNKKKSTDQKKNGRKGITYYSSFLKFLLISTVLIALVVGSVFYSRKNMSKNVSATDNYDNIGKYGTIESVDSVSNEIVDEQSLPTAHESKPEATDHHEGAIVSLIEKLLPKKNLRSDTSFGERSCIENKEELRQQLQEYKLFLANASYLIARYINNKGISEELKVFVLRDHPSHIDKIIKLFQSYNLALEKYKAEEVECKDSDSWQVKILSKFVKIQKISSNFNEVLMIKSELDTQLEIFVKYIYSQNVQGSFIDL